MDNKLNLCVVDFSKEDFNVLRSENYSLYNASAGKKVRVHTEDITYYCLPGYNFPQNIHEYEIVIINMLDSDIVSYSYSDHKRDKLTSKSEKKLEIVKPCNLFDPKPLSLSILSDALKEIRKRKSMIIIFAEASYKIEYQPILFMNGETRIREKSFELSNYSFLNGFPLKENKNGKKYNVITENTKLKELFENHTEIEYFQTFSPPLIPVENGKSERDLNFQPILENITGEVVSFEYCDEISPIYVFPDIKNKGEFTRQFLSEIASQHFPELFSLSKSNEWLSNEIYQLPGEHELIQKKTSEISRHKLEIENIENEILNNSTQYKFLHDLICETDSALVNAVAVLLKWLGFENVLIVERNQTNGVFEEDIRIEYENKILVVEVKGIRGTSKDNECSQISKIRYRRMKERNSTNVYALYIVNHERFKPPHLRQNPPFNEIQIQDAINDERGLLTTWELFLLYNDIISGIFSKHQILDRFFTYGNICFRDSLDYIGKIDKTYQNNISSIELSGKSLSVGETIFAMKNQKIIAHKIISMQKEKEVITTDCLGRIGLKTDENIEKNSLIYKKR